MLTLGILRVPLKAISEANGSRACINHNNIQTAFLSKPHPIHCKALPVFIYCVAF